MSGDVAPEPTPATWWRTYFDDVFYALNEPFFSPEDTRREAAAMLDLLGLPVGSRLLDVPCGWGRHTRVLAGAGIEVFGADISVPLLGRAAADLREAEHPVRLAAADLRALSFRDGAFDGVVHVFTSLGLFDTDEDDLRALGEIRRVLRPGGRFLLETMHRDDVVCAYAEHDDWTLPDGTEVRVRRRFDAVRGVSRERWQWRRGEDEGVKEHVLRLRTATEVDRLLTRSGFGRVRYLGDWSGEPFARDSARLIAVAERDA